MWDAIVQSPWIGTGFGSFPDIFPWFRDGRFINDSVWSQAHNSYLENALELGVPATIALNLSVALVGWRCFRGFIRRHRRKTIPLLGVCATVLVAAHALVDFSLQIPAVSVLFAFMLGTALAQSWSSRDVTEV